MKRFIKVLFSLAIIFVVSQFSKSFAFDWPTQLSNTQNNPVVFDGFRENNSTYTISTGSSIAGLSPVVGDGKVFYASGTSTNHTLHAVSLKSGSELWQKTFSRQILNITYDNGRIYFGAVNIYSLDANTGTEIWKTNVCGTYPSEVLCKLLRVEEGKVYGFKSISNSASLLVIDEATGSILQNRSDITFNISATMLSDDNNVYLVDPGNATSIIKISKPDYIKSTPFKNCPITSGSSILDKENSVIYVTANNYLCSYNLETNETKINMTSGTYGGFAKYGNTIYAIGNYSLNTFSASETNPDSIFYKVLGFIPSSGPLIVNGVIYFGTSDGRIRGINLETEETNTWTVESGTPIKGLIYSDGQLIASGRISNVNKLFVLDQNNFSLRPDNYTISLESPYKTDSYNQYLGQLHAHYRPESPLQWLETYKVLPTPFDLEKRYKDAGYDFVALTEHNEIVSDPGVEGLLHISNSEENTPDGEGGHILALGINNLVNFALPDQNRINDVASQGGIPILAHPNYSYYPWSGDSLTKLRSYKHLEIFQGAGRYTAPFSLIAGNYYATDKLDLLASAGKEIYGTAGDDYTPMDGGFDQAAVTVFSKTKDQIDVMQNLDNGNFYARQGSSAPNININISGSSINITSDKLSEIKFIGAGGRTLKTDYFTYSSTYNATGEESYIRAEITCANGIDLRTSWTQPIKVSKNKASQTSTSGMHYFDLGQTGLVTNTTDVANASILSTAQYPSQSPQLGYLSPVYSFSTAGQVLDGTNLSISYANRSIFTNENNLAIYTYNELNSSWDKVVSNVDKINKVVSANLSHFSLYTLSAEQIEDTDKPVVSLISPTDLSGLSGITNLEASAGDNNAVTEVRFSLNDKLVTQDTDISDGWKAEINANDFAIGNHRLKLEAEDFSGNIGNFETTFTIAESTFDAPTTSLLTPGNEQYLNNKFTVSGNYSSQNGVQNISIYLDDIYLSDADFSSGAFQKEIDFSQFKEDKHSLKVVLTDIKDNITETTIAINVGDELKIDIISPLDITYLHSETILFQYQTIPANPSDIVAKIDGNEIANNTSIDAFQLPLGSHRFSVEKNGRVYAETNFTISTNLMDQTKLVEKMYSLGHIKNFGITTAIQAHLITAQLFEKLETVAMRDRMIRQTIKFINQQNKQKRPLIDEYTKEIIIGDLNYLLNN